MRKVNQTSRYFSRKLSDEQKDEIVSLKGTISAHECAKRYDGEWNVVALKSIIAKKRIGNI